VPSDQRSLLGDVHKPNMCQVSACFLYEHGSESIDDEQVVLGPVFVPDQGPIRRQPPLPVDLELDLVLALHQSVMLLINRLKAGRIALHVLCRPSDGQVSRFRRLCAARSLAPQLTLSRSHMPTHHVDGGSFCDRLCVRRRDQLLWFFALWAAAGWT